MKSILFFSLMVCLTFVACNNSTDLRSIKANNEVSVSGVSSGGFMSAQMLVAYSGDIQGAGLFASGPYFCTRGTIMTTADCMTTGVSIYTDQLLLAAAGFETLGLIDPLSNIKNSNVYIFSGQKDWVVWTEVVKKNEEFFRKLGANIKADYSVLAEHSFPTDSFGNKCDTLGSPYINNCNFKGAKLALEHILNKELDPKVDIKEQNLLSFNQDKYNPGITSSFGKTGYIYVPDGCKNKACTLHVAFHGCSQTIGDIGLDYVKSTGYLGIAEANDFIVLFPQVKTSSIYPYNPKGCWDWWGYSEVIPFPVDYTFPTNVGTQMKAVYRMIKDLQSGNFKTDAVFQYEGPHVSSY